MLIMSALTAHYKATTGIQSQEHAQSALLQITGTLKSEHATAALSITIMMKQLENVSAVLLD